MNRGAPLHKMGRVAIASSGLGRVARGIEAWASDLAVALHGRGLDVTLCKGGGAADASYERIIPCWPRVSAAAQWVSRVVPRALAWRLGLQSPYGVEQMSFAVGLVRFLRSERIDLLHVQDPVVALIAERARRLGLVRTKTILAHGTEEGPEFLRRFSYVQHLAPEHARLCTETGAWKPEWTAIPNFVDTEVFSPGSGEAMRRELGIPREGLVVLIAAAVKRKHKRVDVLIEEFARLRAEHPGLPVWLVVAGGREPETDEVVSLGRERLGDRVRFLVNFPRERMRELYRAADVFVLASLKEMMPVALLEAMASGLPCVVHKHEVLRWMVGEGGLVRNLAAPGVLAESLAELLSSASSRKGCGAAARRHCVAQFGRDAVVEQILGYYGTVDARFAPACGGRAASPAGDGRRQVSVVIPTFNGASWIADAVRSALSQAAPAREVIVVDDGSTDGTREVLARFMGRIRYETQENRGVAAARNRGIELASGEFIAFLDADDVWHPRKLELQMTALRERPEVGCLGCGVFDWPGVQPEGIEAPAMIGVPWRSLAVRNRLTTSSVVVRREVLDRTGMFDPALRGPEDYDLWLRIAEVSGVAVLDAPLVGYRTVAGSLGRQATSMEQGLRRILRKLDARGAWRADWLLRFKARSYARYSCAFLHGAAGNQAKAVGRLLGSLLWYPFPYHASEVRMPLARPRMLTMLLLRWLRLRPGHELARAEGP